MSRGSGWWGTPPLVVGAIGLAMLGFGAKWLPEPDETNAQARQEATKLEQALEEAVSPEERKAIVRGVEETLSEEGKQVNLHSLVPRRDMDADLTWVAKVGEAYYQAHCDQRDARGLLVGRIAFYAGLVLVFVAGVLLYRRTPDSIYKAW